ALQRYVPLVSIILRPPQNTLFAHCDPFSIDIQLAFVEQTGKSDVRRRKRLITGNLHARAVPQITDETLLVWKTHALRLYIKIGSDQLPLLDWIVLFGGEVEFPTVGLPKREVDRAVEKSLLHPVPNWVSMKIP